MDDVLIYSNNLEDHLKDIAEVFKRLETNQLHVKLSKCEFLKEKLEWCGMEVSTNGFAIQQSQIDAMCEYPPFDPHGKTTVTTYVQQFLGSVRFFADFIPWLGEIATPLYELTKKDNTKAWNVEHQSIQRVLQHYLTNAPQLKYFDPELPTGIKTDASDFAIGGWLYQLTSNGDTNIVAYWSRKLIPAETHYPVHERELLAIHDFVERFRVYLFGIHFDCFTDHKGLEHIQTQPKLSSRQVRWIQYLQDFNFTIEYLPGKSNTFADWLSRRPDFAEHKCIQCSLPVMNLGGVDIIKDSSLCPIATIDHTLFDEQIRAAQLSDPFCMELDTYLHTPDSIPYSKKGFFKSFDKVEDIWFYQQEAIVVPNSGDIRLKLLEHFHNRIDHGHKGIRKTYQDMVGTVYWKELFGDIEKFVSSCPSCQRAKIISNRHGLLNPLDIPDGRFKSVNIDFKPLPKSLSGNDQCLIIIDRFTKLTELIPCKTTSTAEDIALLFYEKWYLKGHGTPESIVSDRDKLFTSNFWKAFVEQTGTHMLMSTARHQQTDGGAESMVKELKIALGKFVNHRQDNWEELLPALQFAHNNSIHSSTKFKPFYLAYVLEPRILQSSKREGKWLSKNFQDYEENLTIAYRNIVNAQTAMKNDYNRNHDKAPIYKVGDMVLLKREGLKWSPTNTQSVKLLQPYLGPFKITAMGQNNLNVTLDLPFWMQCHREFHISLIKAWIDPSLYFPSRVDAPYNPPAVNINDEGDEFEVECILDERIRRNKKEFLVQWKGYDQSHNSWEPESYVANCNELLMEYKDQKLKQIQWSPTNRVTRSQLARGAVVNMLSLENW